MLPAAALLNTDSAPFIFREQLAHWKSLRQFFWKNYMPRKSQWEQRHKSDEVHDVSSKTIFELDTRKKERDY